jgi:hypothetical protein
MWVQALEKERKLVAGLAGKGSGDTVDSSKAIREAEVVEGEDDEEADAVKSDFHLYGEGSDEEETGASGGSTNGSDAPERGQSFKERPASAAEDQRQRARSGALVAAPPEPAPAPAAPGPETAEGASEAPEPQPKRTERVDSKRQSSAFGASMVWFPAESKGARVGEAGIGCKRNATDDGRASFLQVKVWLSGSSSISIPLSAGASVAFLLDKVTMPNGKRKEKRKKERKGKRGGWCGGIFFNSSSPFFLLQLKAKLGDDELAKTMQLWEVTAAGNDRL